MLIAALLGGAIGFVTADSDDGTGPVRGTLQVPWYELGSGVPTVRLGSTVTEFTGSYELPRASDDASGLLSVTDPEGRVQGLRVLPQSADFALEAQPVTARSTAAALVMTAPGVVTNDPYIDAITLGAIERTTALDGLVDALTDAADGNPDWYADQVETLLRQHAGPVILEAYQLIRAAGRPEEQAAPVALPATEGPLLWAADAEPSGNPLAEMLEAAFSVQPQRESCDSPGMVDKDGLEGDGVCMYALGSPPDLAELDLEAFRAGEVPAPVQRFRAVNDTPRWVLVYGGNATVPVALIPPKQWKLGPIEEMLVMIGQTTWASDNTVSNNLKDFLELIGLEYLRSDDTFREQLELRLRPYNEPEVVDFSVTADLLADGLVTVTWWPNQDGRPARTLIPEVDGALIAPSVGANLMQVMTLSTEIVEPVARLAASVGRKLKTPQQLAAEKARFAAANDLLVERNGRQTVNNLCLTGAERQPSGLGGSLYGSEQSLESFRALAGADGDLARDELECRFRRQLSRRILRALADSVATQMTDGTLNERLADGDFDSDDTRSFAYQLLQDVSGAVQQLAAEAVGGDGVLGAAMGSLLTIEIFPDEITDSIVDDALEGVQDEVSNEVRSSLLDGVAITAQDLSGQNDSGKTVREQLNELDGSIDEIFLNVVGALVAEKAVELIAARVGEALVRRFATSFAAVLQVREIANMALDAGTILLTIAELIEDSRYLDTADVYGPVIYRRNDDGTVTDILSGARPGQAVDNGDGTVTVSPSPDGIPTLLWQADLPGYVADTELTQTGDLIGLYDPMVTNDTYGTYAAADLDGNVQDVARQQVSVTDAGVATLSGRVDATVDLASLLGDRPVLDVAVELPGLDVHGLDGVVLTVTHETAFSFLFTTGVEASVVFVNSDGTVRWTQTVDDLGQAWVQTHGVDQPVVVIDRIGGSDDTFEVYDMQGSLLGTYTGFDFGGLFTVTGPNRDLQIGPIDSSAVSVHRFNGGSDPVWAVSGSTECTALGDDPERACAQVDRWHVGGDYAVATYTQGGFEVRRVADGSRLLVADQAGTGDAVTEVSVDGNRLLVGDDDGQVLLYDLSAQSGFVGAADAVAGLRLGDGRELAPVTALTAYGDDLVAASSDLGRIYRYRQTTTDDGQLDYMRLWEFPLASIVDATATEDAVYLLSDSGTVSAFR